MRYRLHPRMPTGLAAAVLGCWLALAVPVAAAEGDASDGLPRHALEIKALTEPEAVLKELPAAIDAASEAGDPRELALLQLAHANACRVMADWRCQREAGAAAAAASEQAADPILQVRGLIAEARGLIALQDYTRGEQLLGSAQTVLAETPSPELSADVFLAYSSLSEFLGKHESGLRYAGLGLEALGDVAASGMRTRLLRNQARAQTRLGQFAAARQSLRDAQAAAQALVDPKLHAELALETARVARLTGDIVEQVRMGDRILELGKQVQNSQLGGLGEEVLGLAALDAGNRDRARQHLQAAAEAFRALGLDRDELRVTRQLLDRLIEDAANPTTWRALAQRFLMLERDIAQTDRAKAADDYEARLKYAQQETEVLRLASEAELARERAQALAQEHRLTRWLMISALVTLVVLAFFFWLQRRSNRKLEAALAARRESEAKATDLLRLSKGMVFLHDLRGELVMVNLATAEALGTLPEQLVGRALGEFLADASRAEYESYLKRLAQAQQDEGTLVVRNPGAGDRLWRYSSRLSETRGYAIGHAVDITEQAREAEALRAENLRDALTQAYNRRYLPLFESELGERPWAVINVDLDQFKLINDNHGHDEGDRVLVAMTRYLEQQVGSADAVVRSGGDEFILLLADGDETRVQRLLAQLRADMPQSPCRYSLGHARRQRGEPLGDTLARADAAMYALRRAARERRA
jgi:diguanylate cyclase (GGDEF)-like protein/PAS domain S-box-containing protein